MNRRHPGLLALLWLAAAAVPMNLPAAQPQDGYMYFDTTYTGARVFGRYELSVALNNLWLQSVQFKVDGQPIGPPATTPPYRVNWDTATVADGFHTLTAVALGTDNLEYNAGPITVRVSNAAPPAAAVMRYEETAISYGPGWQPHPYYDWLAWSGGTGSAMDSTTAGAMAWFSFNGTSVTWIGYRGLRGGMAEVYVDGAYISKVDTFGRRDENMARVFTVGGLAPGNHTFGIVVTGEQNVDAYSNLVVIDAFDVPRRQATSHLQESDPALAVSANWTLDDGQRPWSGGFAYLAQTAGAVATLTFRGSEVRWISYHGPECGIARVYVDGVFVREVDNYAAHTQVQELVFEATGLAPGALHTLTIEATGRANPAASAAKVVLDAFDVTNAGERFEQNEWAVSYTGDWVLNNNKPWSEGTSMAAYYPDLTATLKFVGTGVSWIGFRAARTGIAQVYVDGVRYPDVDCYVPSGEGWQDTVFSVAGLAPGAHTLQIKVTGEKNPNATNAYIVVDAFDVVR
jgi:hypothetical protein